MDELKLAEAATLDEFQSLGPRDSGAEQAIRYDPASRYSLHHLNNEEAIGYQNLEERAANIENNNDLAHESVFDKMMADFFLKSRGDYKKGNKLMGELEELFRQNLQGLADGPASSAGKELEAKGAGADGTLGELYQRQSGMKDDYLALPGYHFPALMDLDIAVNRQLHQGKGGLSRELREMEEGSDVIPPFFDFYDVRKPAHLYVQDKLRDILEELFAARRSLEKHLSRSELVAYD